MPPDVYGVRQVTRYLRELLETNRHLVDIWVGGEVSNLTRASSGHIYFTLKDGPAALRCVFFRSRNAGQRDHLEAGASLYAHGSLSLYEARGDLSFIVDFVQAQGVGAEAAEFERLRARLDEEGLFAPERKRALPRFPRRIGVVTSPTGAVYHDIVDVLARRWPLATVLMQPTVVQGVGAGALTAEALRTLAREHRPDVIIVARGGGSAEDLATFNEEAVPRAIVGSPVPVVSAVGHETDTTLADLAADVRAPTPSAAAELVAPDRAEVTHRIDALQHRGEQSLLRTLSDAHARRDRAVTRLDSGLPDIDAARSRVHRNTERAARGLSTALASAHERSATVAARLETLSPLATLNRGYAIVVRPDGTPVGSANRLQANDRVELHLRDGRRAATIEAD